MALKVTMTVTMTVDEMDWAERKGVPAYLVGQDVPEWFLWTYEHKNPSIIAPVEACFVDAVKV